MKSLYKTATASILLGSFIATANAGQIFAFQNPVANGSYTSSMFETIALFPGNTSFNTSIQNIYSAPTDLVTIDVTNFSNTGVQQGVTQHYAARYFLSNSGSPLTNDAFQGTKTSGAYATGDGLLTFVNPTDSNDILLQIAFTDSTLSFGNFAAAGTIGFSGRLKTTGEIGNENASFGFPDRYTLAGNNATAHHTGAFTSSIGTTAVPEPATMTVLAIGGIAVLRRRRRA